MTREIPLTQGKVALVSDEDFERINCHKWTFHLSGYAYRQLGPRTHRKFVFMHRLIMNTPDGMETDHINGDKLDNRRENLRVCTTAENQRNRGRQINNKSGYKGVSWDKKTKKWHAIIRIGGTPKHLGFFTDASLAALAYDQAAQEYHGEFALTNFKEESTA